MSTFTIYNTAVGYIRIEHHNHKVSKLEILADEPANLGVTNDFSEIVFNQLLEYFRGERREFDIEVDISSCTTFQQRIYIELQKIPYGETRTYKEIATLAGNPKASRAVGLANNRNPITIIIPCHRVIGSRGDLVGYASGLDVKRFLLDLEKLY
ncbi:MAG: methylated-DNA--[protein]-cysteine S-methyltransferase [Rikenellaceae bacterium]